MLSRSLGRNDQASFSSPSSRQAESFSVHKAGDGLLLRQNTIPSRQTWDTDDTIGARIEMGALSMKRIKILISALADAPPWLRPKSPQPPPRATPSRPSEPSGYLITDFGAVADNKTVNTKAIQAAIDKCASTKKGGVVVVPRNLPKRRHLPEAGRRPACGEGRRTEGHHQPGRLSGNPIALGGYGGDVHRVPGECRWRQRPHHLRRGHY